MTIFKGQEDRDDQRPEWENLEKKARTYHEKGDHKKGDFFDQLVNSYRRRYNDLTWPLPPVAEKHVQRLGLYRLNHPRRETRDLFATGSDSAAFGRAALVGEGPLSEEEMDDALGSLEVVIRAGYDPTIEVVIAGRDGWDPEYFADLIADRRGRRLRVYSQELFFWWVKYRLDPLKGFNVEKACQNHPLLDFLLKNNFHWPTAEISPSHGGLTEFGNVSFGVLGRMGYRVGHNGVALAADRWGILRQVFESPSLPPVGDFQHMATWGTACSGPRLQKMAEAIASFARNAARKEDPSLNLAINQWKKDLDWLKTNLYQGRFDRTFCWPNPNVW